MRVVGHCELPNAKNFFPRRCIGTRPDVVPKEGYGELSRECMQAQVNECACIPHHAIIRIAMDSQTSLDPQLAEGIKNMSAKDKYATLPPSPLNPQRKPI